MTCLSLRSFNIFCCLCVFICARMRPLVRTISVACPPRRQRLLQLRPLLTSPWRSPGLSVGQLGQMRPDDDLAHFSPILHHSSPIFSVLAPGSRTARKNGEKTAENGAETAEKEWLGQVDLPYRQPRHSRTDATQASSSIVCVALTCSGRLTCRRGARPQSRCCRPSWTPCSGW